EQQAGRGQALDHAIEQSLGLSVDPVQILEDQQQRLLLALAQEYALEGIERALTPLGRIELEERAVLRQRVQERQQGRDRILEGRVERQHLPGHLGPYGACVVALFHVAVALQQVDDREIGRRFAVRD